MIHVNFLTCSKIRELPEWDKERFPESEYDFQFNSTEDRVWDCVVDRQNVPYVTTFRCKKGRVLYTNCEPPSAWPLPESFINQFDAGVVQNPKVKHPNMKQHHGYESWTVGRSYETKKNRYFYKDLASLEPVKTKNISIITSTLNSLPGHVKRLNIVNRLVKDFPGQIDLFGRGHKYVDVKGDALLPYRFHICIENAFIPNCWTEKFADPVLAQTVPIYAGCTNLADDLGNQGYIPFDIDDYESLKHIIESILENPEGEYVKYKEGLESLRKTLMEKENIIPYVIDFINNNPTEEVREYTLKPLEECDGFKYQRFILGVKRRFFKYYFNTVNILR